jgi:hypothetical protein
MTFGTSRNVHWLSVAGAGGAAKILDKSIMLRDDRDDSGDMLIAFTRKGLSGDEVAIRGLV